MNRLFNWLNWRAWLQLDSNPANMEDMHRAELQPNPVQDLNMDGMPVAPVDDSSSEEQFPFIKMCRTPKAARMNVGGDPTAVLVTPDPEDDPPIIHPHHKKPMRDRRERRRDRDRDRERDWERERERAFPYKAKHCNLYHDGCDNHFDYHAQLDNALPDDIFDDVDQFGARNIKAYETRSHRPCGKQCKCTKCSKKQARQSSIIHPNATRKRLTCRF